MTLNEYIEKIKLEHNIEYSTQAIENYVTDKAKKLLKSRSGAVDDETVKAWILEFNPKKEDEEEKTAKKAQEDKKDFDKPIGNPKQEKGQWGEQQSLF